LELGWLGSQGSVKGSVPQEHVIWAQMLSNPIS